jgi:hypothetical protein
MIIIQGEMLSGKSRLAIDLVKNNDKSLYLTLDKDHSVIKTLKHEKIDYTLMNSCFLMDIKYRILERGGLLNNDLDLVVIDSLNKIKDKKTYNEKINYLLEVEKDFQVKIIATMNSLRMLDNIQKKIENIKGVEFITI